MSREITASRLRIVLGLAAVIVCRNGYSQENTDPKASPKNAQAMIALDRPADTSLATAAPSPYRFVGEISVGKTRYFAVQDTEKRISAWYQARDKIGDYEIIGPKDASLLLQSTSRSILLPLNGALITGEGNAATPSPVESTPKPLPTIRMYLDGKLVEGKPDQLSP